MADLHGSIFVVLPSFSLMDHKGNISKINVWHPLKPISVFTLVTCHHAKESMYFDRFQVMRNLIVGVWRDEWGKDSFILNKFCETMGFDLYEIRVDRSWISLRSASVIIDFSVVISARFITQQLFIIHSFIIPSSHRAEALIITYLR